MKEETELDRLYSYKTSLAHVDELSDEQILQLGAINRRIRDLTPWRIIADQDVRHIWADPDGTNEVRVSPTFYAQAGTPICDCDSDYDGEDKIYVRTEVY